MKALIFVGIGEVLYDVFEDGSETLGGAPLNVAVHAHQLARQLGIGEGIVASCVSSDSRGMRILDSLNRLGMSTRYIANDPCHPTGVVSVFMRNGEPGYQIEAGAAWDYLADSGALRELAARSDAVCFGSLAQRASTSRETIRQFLQNAPQAIRLYDVNLRRNTLTGEAGYSPEVIETSCQSATIIKTNWSELLAVFKLLGIECAADEDVSGIRRRMELLLARYPVQTIVVTRGAEGTVVATRDGGFDLCSPFVSVSKPHPVGAGDACSAGILLGFTLGWDISPTMELANRMGAHVATQPSATPPLSDSVLEFARAQMRREPSGPPKLF
jgi:fructokinase